MKKQILNLSALCLAATLFSFMYDTPHELAGIWNFTIKDAPEGYQEGSIAFTEKDGTIKGEMVTDNGTFPMEHLKISNDTITYDLEVSSNVIRAILVKMKDSIAGKLITPQGDLVITGNKKIL